MRMRVSACLLYTALVSGLSRPHVRMSRRHAVSSSSAQVLALFMAMPGRAADQACASTETTETTPTAMKAVSRAGAGDFTFEDNYAVPVITSPTSVLVEVKAAAINPVDYKIGKMLLGRVVGLDFSGIVKQVGADVSSLAVGDEVFGTAAGSLAEFVVADAGRIARKPTSLSFGQAAAVPTAYLTGLQALRAAGMGKASKVLVIGASGGCGSAGVQLAKALGAKEIVGVASGKNREMVRAQGADRVIDYQLQSLADEPAEYDVVYDTASSSGAGEDYRASGLVVLAPPTNGRRPQYVAINGGLSVWLRKFIGWEGKDTQLILTDANTEDLELLARMADDVAGTEFSGRIAPVIFKTLPFAPGSVDEGFALLRSRRVVGKVVFEM